MTAPTTSTPIWRTATAR